MLPPQTHPERDGTLRFCRSRNPACGPPASSSQRLCDLDHRVKVLAVCSLDRLTETGHKNCAVGSFARPSCGPM